TDDLTIAGRAGVPDPTKPRRAEALCQEGGSKNHPGSVADCKPGKACKQRNLAFVCWERWIISLSPIHHGGKLCNAFTPSLRRLSWPVLFLPAAGRRISRK